MCESTELVKEYDLPYHVISSNLKQGVGVIDKLKICFEKLAIIKFEKAFDFININQDFSYYKAHKNNA